MIFGIWAAVAVMAASWALSKLFSRDAESPTVDRPEVDMPLAEDGQPVPICYGRVRLRVPQVMWWKGAMREHPHLPKDELYLRASLQLGLGLHVANNDINRIYVGDRKVWQGFVAVEPPLADEARLMRDDTIVPRFDLNLWSSTPDGIPVLGRYGKIKWYPGTDTQGQSAFLVGNISDPVPNFRGFSYLLFEDCSLGPNSTPPAIHVEVVGYPDALNGASTREISNHANPMEVIYDLLTNPWGRLGLDTALIGTTSFQAAAVTLDDESHGISVLVDRATSCVDVIREILSNIDAVLYIDPLLGTLEIALIRDDYTVAALPEFTDDHMDLDGVEEMTQTTWENVIDQIRVSYEARLSNSKTTTAIAQNMATFYGRSPNRVRSRDLRYQYIKSWGQIRNVAARELSVASQPVLRARIPFNREAFDLRPGDVFRWSSDSYGWTDRVMRVVHVDFGGDDGNIKVLCFEDRFALDKPVFGDPVEVVPITFPDPQPATVRQTIEMPQWMGYRAEVEGLVANRDHARLFTLARPPGDDEDRYIPHISEDAGTTYTKDGEKRRFATYAKVQLAYNRTIEPYDTATHLRIKALSDPNVLQAQTEAQIRAGGNLVLGNAAAGQEIVSYESFDELAINAAAEVWIYDASTDVYVDETTDFNDAGDADWSPVPTSEAVDDYVAIGLADKFTKLDLDNANGTAGVGGTGTWQYWSESGQWLDLAGVTDGTSGFTATAADGQIVTFTAPTDWATRAINGGSSLYFIRFVVTGAYSTNPVYDQGTVGGVYRLKNIWRSQLDTSPINLAVNDDLWFVADDDVWLENLGELGLDGDEAAKIKLQTFDGVVGMDLADDTAEDLQLVNRSLLPYPVDTLLVAPEPAINAWDSADDARNEYPGETLEGDSDRWIVGPEILPSFLRRLRTQESIRRGDDADEDPDETDAVEGLGATTYDVDVDADGGGFVNIGNVSDDGTPINLEPVAFSTASASEALRVRTKRADDAADRYSFTSPEVKTRLAEYRQLLPNPSFDDATDGRGWTLVSGTVAYVDSADALGFDGKYVHATSSLAVLERVVDVQALSAPGKDAHLIFYARDLWSGSTDSVRVKMISETSSGTPTIPSDDSGDLTPSTTHWDRHVLSINNLHASTAQIRIRIELQFAAGVNVDGAVDGFDLRICGNLSADQVSNGGFNTDLTGWTANDIARAADAGASEGAGYVFGEDVPGGNITRTIALAGGFTTGDVIWLRCRRRDGANEDAGTVSLIAKDAGGNALRTATTGPTTTGDPEGIWQVQDLYLIIPNTCTQYTVGFETDGDAQFDDVSVHLCDLS
jgi:hypothetical protein